MKLGKAAGIDNICVMHTPDCLRYLIVLCYMVEYHQFLQESFQDLECLGNLLARSWNLLGTMFLQTRTAIIVATGTFCGMQACQKCFCGQVSAQILLGGEFTALPDPIGSDLNIAGLQQGPKYAPGVLEFFVTKEEGTLVLTTFK